MWIGKDGQDLLRQTLARAVAAVKASSGLILNTGKVKAAILRLMTDKDGAEMRERAGELKKAAAECTGKAGSSCQAIDKLITHVMTL
ncbi:hypothetical protein EJB05_03790, partial [Eragrostis curvula]